MSKIKQKYNKIRDKMVFKSKNILVFSGRKISRFFDIDRNYIKSTIFIGSLVFVILFSFIYVISINQVKRDISAIKFISGSENINVELERKIRELTNGYPIEKMSKYIAREDEEVAAFLVSIAKKESNWGKRTPKLNGEECYNYWGFRKKRERMGSGGHTCFDNPKDAVKSVASRVSDLIEKKVDTPEKMVVWKCGYSCKSHSPQSVQKWISDVGYYYEKI